MGVTVTDFIVFALAFIKALVVEPQHKDLPNTSKDMHKHMQTLPKKDQLNAPSRCANALIGVLMHRNL